MRKLKTFCLIFILPIIMSSCYRNKNEIDSNNPVNSIQTGQSKAVTNTPLSEDIEMWDRNKFKEVGQLYVDIDINIEKDKINRNANISFDADLNGDNKKDTIIAEMNEFKESTININGQILTFIIENFVDLKVIDLNDSDNYSEVMIKEGTDEYFIYKIFRFDGKNIIHIGDINSFILVSDDGIMLSSFHTEFYLDPMIIAGYYKLKENTIEYSEVDISKYVPKEYTVVEDFSPFFEELDQIPEDWHNKFTDQEVQLKVGDKLKVLEIKKSLDTGEIKWYYVELPSGKKGKIYYNFG